MFEYDTLQNLSERSPAVAPNTLQVRVDLLDTLMNLAGELVLSRNQLLQGISASNMKTTELSGQRIDMVTSELQEIIMRTRMQPIAGLFETCCQAVNALARQSGKPVHIETHGKDVELDKTILESIHNPLSVLVESSFKETIEAPEKRTLLGKDPIGRIRLRAFHDAGQINIAVSDDGCGIAPERALETAVTGIENLGGVIEVEAKPDQGTRFLIKLPLTLAIIPSQIASVGGERYAIPQANLSELIRIPEAEVKERIKKIGDADVVKLRDELLPLLDLHDILGLEKTYTDPDTGLTQMDRRKSLADRRSGRKAPPDKQALQKRSEKDRRQNNSASLNIAVVFSGNYKFGLVIDQLHDSEEIVVKSVGRHLKKFKAYAGATIMGDGKVALILDVLNLAQLAGLSPISESDTPAHAMDGAATEKTDKASLIVFRNQDNEHFAAPIEAVERIERLPSSSIEQIGKQKVIQYRGGALPLFELSQCIDLSRLPEREQQEVVVFKINDHEFGLRVTPPVDTVEAFLALDDKTMKQAGVKGSLIINSHTTLLLDVSEMAEQFMIEA